MKSQRFDFIHNIFFLSHRKGITEKNPVYHYKSDSPIQHSFKIHAVYQCFRLAQYIYHFSWEFVLKALRSKKHLFKNVFTNLTSYASKFCSPIMTCWKHTINMECIGSKNLDLSHFPHTWQQWICVRNYVIGYTALYSKIFPLSRRHTRLSMGSRFCNV